jgi:hypothetical protein
LKRKMLAAREDLVDRVSEIADRRGFTLFGMINDMLELVVRAEDMGLSLREIVDRYEVVRAAKEAGFILGLESLWYDVVEEAYRRDEDRVMKRWFEAGVWCAKCYLVKGIEDPLAAFNRDMQAFTWNASEFSIVKREEDEALVRCISPRFPHSYTTLFSAFLEGALNTFGYKCVERDVARGVIQLRFCRAPSATER